MVYWTSCSPNRRQRRTKANLRLNGRFAFASDYLTRVERKGWERLGICGNMPVMGGKASSFDWASGLVTAHQLHLTLLPIRYTPLPSTIIKLDVVLRRVVCCVQVVGVCEVLGRERVNPLDKGCDTKGLAMRVDGVFG